MDQAVNEPWNSDSARYFKEYYQPHSLFCKLKKSNADVQLKIITKTADRWNMYWLHRTVNIACYSIIFHIFMYEWKQEQ